MCGIAGIVSLGDGAPPAELAKRCRAWSGALRHRGPDEFGLYRDARAGLAHARLSIIDLATGQQPMANEHGTLWIVVQRRDLQLRRAARRARGARPPLPHAQRHRGHRPRLRGVGRARLRALQRPVGARALGRRARRAGAGARSRSACGRSTSAEHAAGSISRARSRRSSPPTRRSRARSIPPASSRPSRSGPVVPPQSVFAGRRGARARATSRIYPTAATERALLGATLSGRQTYAAFTGSLDEAVEARARGARRAPRACACCAPTCRSAAICRAASTARSSPRSAAAPRGERFQHLLAALRGRRVRRDGATSG